MVKPHEIPILIIVTLFSTFLTLYLKSNFLSSTILIFGIPGLYLATKEKIHVKKVALFSLLFSVPFTFLADYLIVRDHGWYIVSTIFPFRLFNTVVLEQFVWGYLFIFYTTIFYEYFLDKKSRKKDLLITSRMKWLSIVLFACLGLFIYMVIYFDHLLRLPYAYAILGAVFGIIPLMSFLLFFPKFTKRFSRGITYFSAIALINEYASLTLHHWIFPGNHFLGTILFFGFPVPYEEVFFYFIISAPMIFTYYEFFDDDLK